MEVITPSIEVLFFSGIEVESPKIKLNSTCDAPYIEPYKQDRIFGSER